MKMGGILTRRRAHGDRNGSRNDKTVDVSVGIDIDWAMLYRIPCNMAVKWVPGGVICTGGLENEGVWAV